MTYKEQKEHAQDLINRGIRIVSFDLEFVETGTKAFIGFQEYLEMHRDQIPQDFLCHMLLFRTMFLKLITKGHC